MPIYGDAGSATTFRDGLIYQDYVMEQLRPYGLHLSYYTSGPYQAQRGESVEGIEVKLDRRSVASGMLAIAIEKRNDLSKPWMPTGIYHPTNPWLYIQGSYQRIYVFATRHLRALHARGTFEEVEIPASNPTGRVFYLPRRTAEDAAVLVVTPRDRPLN